MKAFVLGLAVMAAITVAAWAVLNFGVDMSARQVYSIPDTVRLGNKGS